MDSTTKVNAVLREFYLTLNSYRLKFVQFSVGRQYDKDGNLKQWWNNATINAFRHRAQCIIDQYSRYKVSEVGLYMNGKMTQSENIADNGGLKQAFRVSAQFIAVNCQCLAIILVLNARRLTRSGWPTMALMTIYPVWI